ncbi:MAG: 3-deoxy-D-manno-octulosonic acid transferase [Proteobacteria bacterium]|nr:3-deoxy-D-manno-octulosonic acid transferase [Pseudomonadota bacterium]
MTPALYRGLTTLALPLIRLYLARRRGQGKEDAARFGERLGRAGRARPEGPLIWLHAASVGEALSILGLTERILAEFGEVNMVVTTGTVTSARLLAERLPPRAFHQYVPVDRLAWARRFLDHWRPDIALWVESEFWPNLIAETQARAITMILLNGRMSLRSFAAWRRWPGLIRPLLGGFALCLAQDDDEAKRLRALGAPSVKAPGNLKFASAPLPVDEEEAGRLARSIGARPVWLAASTHAGEEEIVVEAHRRMAPTHRGLLTVIVPRHPNRGQEVAAVLERAGMKGALRSRDDAIAPETEIYIADTLGELGLFYRLCPVAFIGGSLIPHGGQNLLEPARLDCAVIHGPHMENFRAVAGEMTTAGASIEAGNAKDIAAAVASLLDDEAARAARVEAARRIATAKDGVIDAVMEELGPFLKALPKGEDMEGNRARA